MNSPARQIAIFQIHSRAYSDQAIELLIFGPIRHANITFSLSLSLSLFLSLLCLPLVGQHIRITEIFDEDISFMGLIRISLSRVVLIGCDANLNGW